MKYHHKFPITDEDIKGRLVGREGRNVRALEFYSKCDIIIDDTMNISIKAPTKEYFEICEKALNTLIEDGRIHPAKIESVFGNLMTCEGHCDKHFGEIRLIKIHLIGSPYHGKQFWYCQDAVNADKSNGFGIRAAWKDD